VNAYRSDIDPLRHWRRNATVHAIASLTDRDVNQAATRLMALKALRLC